MLLFHNSLKIYPPSTTFRAALPTPRHPSKLRPLFLRYASNDHARNEHIGRICSQVRVVNDQGKLSRMMPFSYVLNSVERKTHFVELVEKEGRIVKIMDSRAVYIREKVQRKTAKKSLASKEVQTAWTVTENDLMVKLKEARRHLLKGHPIDVIFAPKKGVPVPPPEERQRKVDYIVKSLQNCAKEYKERTFDKLVSTIYLKGSDNTKS